jgi:hypothetical protein
MAVQTEEHCGYPSGDCVCWDKAYANGSRDSINLVRQVLSDMDKEAGDSGFSEFWSGYSSAIEEALARLETTEEPR